MGFRVDLGFGLGPLRLGVSNRGFGGGVGPLSAGYSYRRRRAADVEGTARTWASIFVLWVTSIVMLVPAAAVMFPVAWLFRLPDDVRNGWIIGIAIGLAFLTLVVMAVWSELEDNDETDADEQSAQRSARTAPPRVVPVTYTYEDDAPTSPAKRNTFRLTVGDQVDHHDFGTGTVLRVTYDDYQVAAVEYEDGVVRLLNVAFDPVAPANQSNKPSAS